eukprot:3401959-Prorocentrum_lima.AAC.1
MTSSLVGSEMCIRDRRRSWCKCKCWYCWQACQVPGAAHTAVCRNLRSLQATEESQTGRITRG